MTARTIQATRERVRVWEETIRADSEMYSRLASYVAERDEMLDLIRTVPAGQIEMNMLLAAVQSILLREDGEPLAAWYPSLGGTRTDAGLEDTFSRFIDEHIDEIRVLITTRRVQTNEVARCVFLLPAYNIIQALAQSPLALIEVGTSAGLNQNVDRYGYTYRSVSGAATIQPEAPVQLTTDTGDDIPNSARRLPDIGWKAGLDIHPIDVQDEDQARWLRSLVWPDQVERHKRLAAAIEVAHEYPPAIVAGDAFDIVPELVAAAPSENAIVIQHSFVFNQFESSQRDRFLVLLDDIAADRPIYRVGAEWLTRLRHTILTVASHGRDRMTVDLGQVHHHGSWMKLEPSAVLPR